jgi:hypothetical protein
MSENLCPHNHAPCDLRPNARCSVCPLRVEQLTEKDISFAERCDISEKCLPVAPYRDMLANLHCEMLAKIAELEAQIVTPRGEVPQPPKALLAEEPAFISTLVKAAAPILKAEK